MARRDRTRFLKRSSSTKLSAVTGIVVTKLDGTAKGGAVIQIASELRLPIKLIGVGERADDLRAFKAEEFVEALL
jgi:fused signal recognition particle receptor